MADVIEYPFTINYRTVSQDITRYGVDTVKKLLIEDCRLSETIANVIIKQTLKRGWGS